MTHMTIFVTLSHSHKLPAQLAHISPPPPPQTARQRRRGAVSANSNILQTLVQGSSERFHDTLQKFILRRLVRNAAWAVLGWAWLGWVGWAGLGWAGWKSADYIHWSLLIHKAEVNREPTKQIFINLLLHITILHIHTNTVVYILQFTEYRYLYGYCFLTSCLSRYQIFK